MARRRRRPWQQPSQSAPSTRMSPGPSPIASNAIAVPSYRLRLWASAARTARPCGESRLELTFQTLGRDVMFGLNLHRDLEPDPRGLEADDLHVVGQENLHAVAPDESGARPQ